MAMFKKNDGGMMDVIRCDEQDYLIWKWHPKKSTNETSQRANAIRWGSSLRVREGSVAVFVYSQSNGKSIDYVEGPYDQIIDTTNFPVLASLVGVLYQGESPFQAEIYFINTANLIQIPFGVPYFDIFDPRFTDFGVPVAVRGSINFRITDFQEFVRIHSLAEFDMEAFKSQVKDSIVRAVSSVVANSPQKYGVPAIQIGRHISDISQDIEQELTEKLRNEYGITVSSINVSDIDLDKTSTGYKKLEKLTQNKATMFVQGAANIFDTVSTHKSGAKNIKRSAKFDNELKEPKLGEKVSSAIDGLFKGKRDKATPPPIPTNGYYVAIEGKRKGPYGISKLRKMFQDEIINDESLIWKDGMAEWSKAGDVEELASIFDAGVPSIPTDSSEEG